jgi:hypothetical protein
MAVTAAQAIANYRANPNTAPQIVLDTGAALTASLADLLQLQAANDLTSVTLSGTGNSTTAAQLTSLVTLKGFALASGATLVVSDTAANLVIASKAALAKATGVLLTGASNTVTAMQATSLSGLNGFALSPGATLVVSDSAANLLVTSNAAGEAKATGVSLTGANTVTAAQATVLANLHGFALAAGATLVVADGVSNLLASVNAAGLAKATGVSLTGANAVTAVQAATLAALHGFVLASGATLVVSGNATNLLASANAAGLAKATGVSLAGANTVTAAQASSLAGLPGFVLGTGATLVVSDSAPGLLASGNAAGFAKATSILLTGSNTVTAAQATALAGLPRFTLASGASLLVSDTAANLLASANAAGIAKATSVTLSAANTVTAAQAALLATLPGIVRAAGATLVVADSATNLLAPGNAAGLSLASTVLLKGTSNIVSAAQATTLAGSPSFGVAAGAKFVVSDSASNLLQTNNAATLTMATKVILTGASNQVTAAQATTLSALHGFELSTGSLLVLSDTAEDLLLPVNAGGEAVATTVSLIGTNVVTAAQAAILAGLQGFQLAPGATLAISDSAANLLSTTNAAAELLATSVLLTGVNTMTAGQAILLAGLPGFSAATAATMVVADRAANILANLDALTQYPVQLAKMTIQLTDAGTAKIVLTAAQALNDTAVVNKITGNYALSVEDSASSLSNANLGGILKPDLTVAVTGTPVGDTMDLTNIHASAVVDLRGNTSSVSAGLNTPTLAFIGSPDVIVLGATTTSINYTLVPSGGLEMISNFQYGLDRLNIDLLGAGAATLQAYDTSVNGVHAIAIANGGDLTHGIVLLNMPTADTSVGLLTQHLIFNNGIAMVA